VLRSSAPAITEARQWALTRAGKPYDISAICGIACSELIAAAFEVVGSPLLLNPLANVWRITPPDLLLLMQPVPISAISIPY
jgi:uncharacterized protein YycO